MRAPVAWGAAHTKNGCRSSRRFGAVPNYLAGATGAAGAAAVGRVGRANGRPAAGVCNIWVQAFGSKKLKAGAAPAGVAAGAAAGAAQAAGAEKPGIVGRLGRLGRAAGFRKPFHVSP